MKNLAHKTAITRKAPSAPMRYLMEQGLLTGYFRLDYGCGKGFDAERYSMDKFDPHYTDGKIIGWVSGGEMPRVEGKYDTITCNYVLNVIPNLLDRDAVLNDIESLLAPGGKAYITVRRDPQVAEGCTKTGTFQKTVELEDLPTLVLKKGKYQIYVMEKPL